MDTGKEGLHCDAMRAGADAELRDAAALPGCAVPAARVRAAGLTAAGVDASGLREPPLLPASVRRAGP